MNGTRPMGAPMMKMIGRQTDPSKPQPAGTTAKANTTASASMRMYGGGYGGNSYGSSGGYGGKHIIMIAM